MKIDLSNQRALVTGASSGIGRACALAFAEAGAVVAVHARSVEKAILTVDEITAGGGKAFAVEADLNHPAEIRAMCSEAINTLNGIDIVMNNAGIHGISPAIQTDERQWSDMLDVNLNAPRLISQLSVEQMINQGRGFAPACIAQSRYRLRA